jgi:hypothetical protein
MRIKNNPEWLENYEEAFSSYRRNYLSHYASTCTKLLNELIWDNRRFYEHDTGDDMDKYHQRCVIIDSPGGLKDRFHEIWNSHQNLYTRLVEWDRQGWIIIILLHELKPPPEPNWKPQPKWVPGNTQTRLYL